MAQAILRRLRSPREVEIDDFWGGKWVFSFFSLPQMAGPGYERLTHSKVNDDGPSLFMEVCLDCLESETTRYVYVVLLLLYIPPR